MGVYREEWLLTCKSCKAYIQDGCGFICVECWWKEVVEEGHKERVIQKKERPMTLRKKNFWAFIHNTFAHPCIGLFPNRRWSNRFHDWTAKKAGW